MTDARDRAQRMREAPPLPPVPPGFELVDASAGIGKTSIVAKLRRASDGALYAWKRPVAETGDVREAMREQTRRSVEWARLGVSRAPAEWAPDGRTLLQPWVDGVTLRAVIDSSQMLTDAADPRNEALVAMLRKLATARAFVSGLNAMNLVFDGTAWQVIDSGHIGECETPSEAWDRQRSSLRSKWTRGPLADRRRDVDAFLAHADAALALPPVPFSLRRWWRRVRGR